MAASIHKVPIAKAPRCTARIAADPIEKGKIDGMMIDKVRRA
jgi:hypothetical protein